ncbi:MAG: SDR family oxidoreductase, partial [Deltaproteobacteria bacterium]
MTEYGLKERVAVLTITRDGLADKLVERLVEEGCLLAILDHGEIQGKKLNEKIRREGGTSILKQVDLTNKKAVGECFEAIWDYYGHLDFLVNEAEIHNSLSFLAEISTEQWNQVLQLNLKGTFLACQEAVKFMRAQKFGRIINLSSTVSLDFPPCYGAYAISKLGINALTEVLAKEEAKHNIRVNAVALGSVSTDPSALY